MRSPVELPLLGRQEDDPPYFLCDTSTQDLDEVEVVLVQGAWPEATDPIWSKMSLQVAVRIVEARRSKRSFKATKRALLSGWQVAHQYCIAHNDVVGVTNGSFRVTVHSRLGLDIAHSPASQVPGVLERALSDLTLGQRVDRPSQGQPNSF